MMSNQSRLLTEIEEAQSSKGASGRRRPPALADEKVRTYQAIFTPCITGMVVGTGCCREKQAGAESVGVEAGSQLDDV
jgi:hypothetical protein